MTAQEFSDQFDVLYNNITSNQAPGCTEYEKSVFLTKAQDEIVKNYFLPQSNPKNAGFDGNQKRQIDFSSLMTSKSLTTSGTTYYDKRTNSTSITLDDDAWMIVNERIEVTRTGITGNVLLTVRPITFEEYDRIMSKPFKRPLKYQAWRLIVSSKSADLIIGPSDTIKSYTYRYVRKPKPIIVGDLDGLTINGEDFSTVQGCELDPILHEEILQRAVELAKIAWTATGNDNVQQVVQAGQRSE